jgi:hypothetical protein
MARAQTADTVLPRRMPVLARNHDAGAPHRVLAHCNAYARAIHTVAAAYHDRWGAAYVDVTHTVSAERLAAIVAEELADFDDWADWADGDCVPRAVVTGDPAHLVERNPIEYAAAAAAASTTTTAATNGWLD